VEGEIQAVALADLRCSDNELSVWEILDDRSNLQRVIAALAGTRDSLENLDYVLLNSDAIADLGIKKVKTTGGTPDDTANTDWHFDLVQLTVDKIVKIAALIRASTERNRAQVFHVKKYINESIAEGHIDQKKLNSQLLSKLK
jgi:hypothetical protein